MSQIRGFCSIVIVSVSVLILVCCVKPGKTEHLDLTGRYNQDVDISIDGGIRSARIFLPESLGIRVRVAGGLGSVTASGMNKRKKVYTNDSYGKTEFTILINIKAGIGSIDLISK